MLDEISYFFFNITSEIQNTKRGLLLFLCFYLQCIVWTLVFLYIGFAVNIDLLKLLDFLLSNKVGGDQAFAFDESSTSKLTGDSVVF